MAYLNEESNISWNPVSESMNDEGFIIDNKKWTDYNRNESDEGEKDTSFSDEESTLNKEKNKTVFEFLKQESSRLKLPSKWWSVQFVYKALVCARWNAQFLPDHKIVIHKNLTAMIYVGDHTVPSARHVNNLTDVENLLHEIETFYLPISERDDVTEELSTAPDKNEFPTSLTRIVKRPLKQGFETKDLKSVHTVAQRPISSRRSVKRKTRTNISREFISDDSSVISDDNSVTEELRTVADNNEFPGTQIVKRQLKEDSETKYLKSVHAVAPIVTRRSVKRNSMVNTSSEDGEWGTKGTANDYDSNQVDRSQLSDLKSVHRFAPTRRSVKRKPRDEFEHLSPYNDKLRHFADSEVQIEIRTGSKSEPTESFDSTRKLNDEVMMHKTKYHTRIVPSVERTQSDGKSSTVSKKRLPSFSFCDDD